MSEFRREQDFLGEAEVPAEAYYGIQTCRAAQNFPVSGLHIPSVFNRAYAEIKKAAARAHRELEALPPDQADVIIQATDEIIAGDHEDQFIVDVFQAGAGTSHHMNVNEIIANRANEIMGGELGQYDPIHPNDDVNKGQSTNDTYPTAMRVAVLLLLPELAGELESLSDAFQEKAEDFAPVKKSARTHLQDAVPITLGQEFSGYAAALAHLSDSFATKASGLRKLGLGGTAAGTGLNTVPGYRERAISFLGEQTGLDLCPAENMFEAMQSMAPFVEFSGTLRTAATELGRISNDLRLLSSGPTTGLGELDLPAVQPGSSIMPGKINPVVSECMNMICFQIIGNDTCISRAAGAGQMELNVMMPIINYNLLWSIQILTNGCRMLREKCVEGIQANAEQCRRHLHSTIGLATVLNPVIGYHAAAEVAKEAAETNRTIREIVMEKEILTEEEFAKLIKKAVRPSDEPDTF
ncbi:MAG: aspartate ammonia-lyase [Candidatus Brocadiia bacterium]